MSSYCTRCGTKTTKACCEGFGLIAQNDLVIQREDGPALACPIVGCAFRRPLTSTAPAELAHTKAIFDAHQQWHIDHPESLPKAQQQRKDVGDVGELLNVPWEAAAPLIITNLFALLPAAQQHDILQDLRNIFDKGPT